MSDRRAAGSTSRSLGIRGAGPGTSEHKPGMAITYASSSSADEGPEGAGNEWDRRRKRRLESGGKGKLDLVREPDFRGFGESPSSVHHQRATSSSSSAKRRKMLDLTKASSQDSDSSPIAPRRDSPRACSLTWHDDAPQGEPDLFELEPEPSTFDSDEVPPLALSVALTNESEDELTVQAALVPGRGGRSSVESGTVLVEDSDEEIELGTLDRMEVPDSDEEDECSVLARRIGLSAADDSGFGEGDAFHSSAARKGELLYDMDANPTSVLGNAFTANDDAFFAPVSTAQPAPVRASSSGGRPSSSPHSLGRSESGILMPPPPFPTGPRLRQPSQAQSAPRVLVPDTQTQAALAAAAARPVIPSRPVVDETQVPPKPAAFGSALADAWAGQLPLEPRQAKVSEFFAAVPRPTPSGSGGEVEVIEDSQRVPSLGEQVAALAMLRDVREGRRRAQAEKEGGLPSTVVGGAQEEEEDDVEEVEEVAELPSSQPRADECGLGISPLKTPTVDRIFKVPAGWPVSPSKRGRAVADEEECEGVETQWESYWTLASPSASLLAEYQDV